MRPLSITFDLKHPLKILKRIMWNLIWQQGYVWPPHNHDGTSDPGIVS